MPEPPCWIANPGVRIFIPPTVDEVFEARLRRALPRAIVATSSLAKEIIFIHPSTWQEMNLLDRETLRGVPPWWAQNGPEHA